MGYTTEFTGSFTVTPALRPEHYEYLVKFADTRRMKRNEHRTVHRPDRVRLAAGLGIGVDGGYYVGEEGFMGQSDGPDIVDPNSPPSGQPGLWCKWEPAEGGTEIRWNGMEKFYDYAQYLIDHFLSPWGYQLEGIVEYQGEDPDDFGRLYVNGGDTVVQRAGRRVY